MAAIACCTLVLTHCAVLVTMFLRPDDLLVKSRQSVHLALSLSGAKFHLVQQTPFLRAITLNASASV